MAARLATVVATPEGRRAVATGAGIQIGLLLLVITVIILLPFSVIGEFFNFVVVGPAEFLVKAILSIVIEVVEVTGRLVAGIINVLGLIFINTLITVVNSVVALLQAFLEVLISSINGVIVAIEGAFNSLIPTCPPVACVSLPTFPTITIPTVPTITALFDPGAVEIDPAFLDAIVFPRLSFGDESILSTILGIL